MDPRRAETEENLRIEASQFKISLLVTYRALARFSSCWSTSWFAGTLLHEARITTAPRVTTPVAP